MKCEYCETRVTDNKSSCPECYAPVPEKEPIYRTLMIVASLILIALVITLYSTEFIALRHHVNIGLDILVGGTAFSLLILATAGYIIKDLSKPQVYI